ncbi:MAG: GntR family transcriptional regulator [Candidatus Ventricola sp.]
MNHIDRNWKARYTLTVLHVLIQIKQKGGLRMFLVNPKSKQPIYEQLVEQLRKQLFLGVVQAGQALPSVRQLATELGINPNTIQKAYRRMEAEGMIISVPGKGSFISDDLADMLKKQRDEQMEKTRVQIRTCRDMGLDKQLIQKLTDEIYGEGNPC